MCVARCAPSPCAPSTSQLKDLKSVLKELGALPIECADDDLKLELFKSVGSRVPLLKGAIAEGDVELLERLAYTIGAVMDLGASKPEEVKEIIEAAKNPVWQCWALPQSHAAIAHECSRFMSEFLFASPATGWDFCACCTKGGGGGG
jgi:hypothetical protein